MPPHTTIWRSGLLVEEKFEHGWLEYDGGDCIQSEERHFRSAALGRRIGQRQPVLTHCDNDIEPRLPLFHFAGSLKMEDQATVECPPRWWNFCRNIPALMKCFFRTTASQIRFTQLASEPAGNP